MKRTTIRIGVIIQVGLIPRCTPLKLGLITESLEVGQASRLTNPVVPVPLPHDARVQAGGDMAAAAMLPSLTLTHDSV